MDNFELVAPDGTDINNDFLKYYRDSLKQQYDDNVAALRQNKINNDTAIMSGANRQGLLYSNFPQRAKIQNEGTYLTKMADLNNTYQTGLDKLKSNAVGTFNQIKDLEDKIKDLNEYAANPTSNNNSTDLTELAKTLNELLGNKDTTNSSNNSTADSIEEQKQKLEGSDENTDWGKTLGGAAVGSSIGGLFVPGLGIWGPILGGIIGSKVANGGGTGTVSGEVKH